MEEKGLEYQMMVLVVYISSIWTPLWYTCLHFDKEDSLLYNEKISQMELLTFLFFLRKRMQRKHKLKREHGSTTDYTVIP